MSFITVGYTDKANRRNPIKPPGGGISDIFSSNFEQPVAKDLKSNKIQETSSVISTNESKTHANGHTESKICEQIQTLTVEENSNEVKTTETTNKSIELNTTITGIKMNEEATNGNLKGEEKNICTTEKTVESTKKVLNNIVPEDEKDSGVQQKRNRVPPGGYSSGLW